MKYAESVGKEADQQYIKGTCSHDNDITGAHILLIKSRPKVSVLERLMTSINVCHGSVSIRALNGVGHEQNARIRTAVEDHLRFDALWVAAIRHAG